MIRPSFLPIGISTSNRIIKPGYESYQPVIAARQFGLGQVPPHFHIHHLVESRADLPDGLTSSRCYSMFDNLHISIPADLSFTSSSIGFDTWWNMWKTHVFRKGSKFSTTANRSWICNPRGRGTESMHFIPSKSSIPFSCLILLTLLAATRWSRTYDQQRGAIPLSSNCS